MPELFPETKAERLGLLLRIGLFVLIGYLGMGIFPFVLYPWAGLLATAALSVFGTALVANAIPVRIFERGRLTDVGMGWSARSLKETGWGVLLGMGAGALVIGIPMATGMAAWKVTEASANPLASVGFVMVILLFGAVGEELLFHGYAFQLLLRRTGTFTTLLPVSVLFGLVHSGNQNANLFGIINTMLWGGVLGYAYIHTRALWLSIGLHFGWNFILPLLGANLSGFTMGVTGRVLEWRAGAFFSGGGYGPEGGIFTTLAAVGLFVLVPRLVPAGVDESAGEVRGHVDPHVRAEDVRNDR